MRYMIFLFLAICIASCKNGDCSNLKLEPLDCKTCLKRGDALLVCKNFDDRCWNDTILLGAMFEYIRTQGPIQVPSEFELVDDEIYKCTKYERADNYEYLRFANIRFDYERSDKVLGKESTIKVEIYGIDEFSDNQSIYEVPDSLYDLLKKTF